MSSVSPVWDNACEVLRQKLGDDPYSRLIAPIVPAPQPDGTLRLTVGDDFMKMYLEMNYKHVIRDALQKVDPSVPFEFVIDPALAAPEPEPVEAYRPAPAAVATGELRGMPLDPNFTFSNFIVGKSNTFANAAARQAAENPGGVYNPLLIYGDTGLGKTHLMQAVAHFVRAKDPRATIVYITLEAMLNDFIECIRNGKAADFRNRYRHTDLLLVDDIQFLTKSDALQEEFFNTFNALQNEHKQIILTSDQPPNRIQGLSDRLVSRFQQGLVTDIQTPDYATRMAILRSKQRTAIDPLPDEFLAYIAENITSNIRLLEGALTRVVCYRNLLPQDGTPLSLEGVKELLRGFVSEDQKEDPTCQDVQRVVAEEFDLRLADMTSKERPQKVAMPRQIAMFLCRQLTRLSLPDIGKEFGKSHATVIHACKTVPGRMEIDRDIHRHVENILAKLGRSMDELP